MKHYDITRLFEVLFLVLKPLMLPSPIYIDYNILYNIIMCPYIV